jgi:hypothetical protein
MICLCTKVACHLRLLFELDGRLKHGKEAEELVAAAAATVS